MESIWVPRYRLEIRLYGKAAQLYRVGGCRWLDFFKLQPQDAYESRLRTAAQSQDPTPRPRVFLQFQYPLC